MITLTVSSYKGAAAPGNLSVGFDELGGTIGRADTNQMVLPDPERGISRVHAQVVFRSGSYALIGRGANQVIHNGKAVAHGSEVTLADGDQIEIGSYCIAVSTRQTARKVDPFEAAFGNSGQHQRPVPAARPSPAAPKPVASAASQAESTGPIRTASADGKPSGFGIPDDWDPFAQEARGDPFGKLAGASNAGQGRPSIPEAPAHGLVPQASREDSLDALFGLGGGAPKGDPFAASPLAPVVAQPNTSAASDPMRALLEPARPGVKVEPDHVSDLNSPWRNARQPAPPQASRGAALPGAVFSWDADARVGKAAGPPTPASPVVAPPAPAPSAPAPVAASPAMAPPAPPPALAPLAHPVAARVQHEALLDALRDGLGTPDLRLASLSPELMRQLGQLLRESTKGTVELLAARAALKREVRADVTTIIANANNSLKFSPSVEVALQYLLGPRMAGFMPPVESMRDAYDDLKAHQLGVMAGMKAALAGVLQRFDPAVVEGKLVGRSGLSSLIPSSRKARLWEMFQELYQQLATEAEEDFNTIFGAAFLRAYQQYIDHLDGPDAKP